MDCLTLAGSLADRQKALADFEDQSKSFVLLLALESDDAGLNLLCANHVFLCHPVSLQDKESSRACERQAIGRSLRFGQEKTVTIHRFLVAGTIEEAIVEANGPLRLGGTGGAKGGNVVGAGGVNGGGGMLGSEDGEGEEEANGGGGAGPSGIGGAASSSAAVWGNGSGGAASSSAAPVLGNKGFGFGQ